MVHCFFTVNVGKQYTNPMDPNVYYINSIHPPVSLDHFCLKFVRFWYLL